MQWRNTDNNDEEIRKRTFYGITIRDVNLL